MEDIIPSGKHTKNYGKWPYIVDLPIKNGEYIYIYTSYILGLEHEFYFSIIYGIIIPTDFHIFQDG